MFDSPYIREVLKFVDTYQRQVGISSDNHNYLGFPTYRYHNKYVANIAESNDTCLKILTLHVCMGNQT